MSNEAIREAFKTLGIDESRLQSQILESFRGQSEEDRVGLVAQLAEQLGVETKTVGSLNGESDDSFAEISEDDLATIRRAKSIIDRVFGGSQ